MTRSLGLALTVAYIASCATSPSSVGATPGNSPGPAFEMVVNGQVRCPSGVTATVCVRVTVTNRGLAGDGTCTLYAAFKTSNGGESRAGPRVPLVGVASGASVKRVLAWTGELPASLSSFGGDCDPGLRS